MKLNYIDGGVAAPLGFKAASAAAGIKYEGRDDMAMIFSEVDCASAGIFTTNVVKAAPVKWDRAIVRDESKNGRLRAIVANAGIANACTGQDGTDACVKSAEAAAEALNISADQVLLASTGVIGSPLPMDKVGAGIKMLSKALSGEEGASTAASKAIMTTDTVNKEIAVEFELGGKVCHIGAISKGVGMIEPNMCTMLCFITTDVDISPQMLDLALRNAAEDSYNMISVDGDMSTNDTVLILASRLAENERIGEKNPDFEIFEEALKDLMKVQAKKHAADGEGATALFEVKVINADTEGNARRLAKSVVNSMLTKAAVFGHDANGGRILCALGYAGVEFDPDRTDLRIESAAGEVSLYRAGAKLDYDEESATRVLSEREVTAVCDMHMGEAGATAWGCDLSYDYVKINADYRS